MHKKLLAIAVILLLLTIGTVAGQEGNAPGEPFVPQLRINQRSLGDQAFAITAGLYIPLFTVLLEDWDGTNYTKGATPPHLYPGGAGAITYSVYLSPNWKLGLQLNGSFSQDINGNFAYTIPITVKASYEFHPWSRVTIPIFIGTGIAMTSWKDDNFLVDFILKPGVGVYFDWSYEWSFGLDFSYLFIPQAGLGGARESSIGNFLEITLTAEYHF
ncbi:MAG: hypothetical protein B0D92_02245 [Spirochaeta sp. LUC14_002_19_P3]|nr:MAG: hypothetical protein B0D92_02245 [Spirochaeta sp. LUC14_002_19_P3]